MLSKVYKYISLFTVVCILFITKFYRLGVEFVHNDAFHIRNWSLDFWYKFTSFQFDNLFLIIQPAVLTVWFNIVGWKLLNFLINLGLLDLEKTGRKYELYLHIFQKIPQTVFSIFLIIVLYFLIKKIFNKKLAFWISLFFLVEPFIIFTTRIIQSDGLLAHLYLLSSLLFISYLIFPKDQISLNSKFKSIGFKQILNSLNLKRVKPQRIKYFFTSNPLIFLILSGFFGGLAFIEKSTGLLLIPTAVLVSFVYLLWKHKNSFKTSFYFFLVTNFVFLITFFITAFIFYPSFWGAPLFTLKRMTYDVFILGIKGYEVENFDYSRTSHLQDSFYYFWTLVLRSSWWLKLGLVLLLLNLRNLRKLKNFQFFIFLLTFPLIYLIVHQVGDKKIARYMATVFAYLTIYSGLGYYLFIKGIKNKLLKKVIVIIIPFIILFNLLTFAPYFNIYYDPIFKPLLLINKEIEGDLTSLSGYIETSNYLKQKYSDSEKIASSDRFMLYLYYPGTVVSESKISEVKPTFLLNACNYREGEKGYIKEKDIYIKGLCVKTLYRINN